MAEIGIDLGTTNSAVAYLRSTPEIIENQGRATTPSVVAWDEDESDIIVGQAAKDQAAYLPHIMSVKRHMGEDKRFELGGQSYTPPEVSAKILESLKKAAEERLGEPVDSAVITIPAHFSNAQNEATHRAGELAGFKSVQLLSEPIAAALAHGEENLVLIYDLGGGTFDVAVIDCLDYKMLGLAGDNYLGGDDFDRRLVDYLAKEVKKQFGVDIASSEEAMWAAKSECEKAKKELSERKSARINFNQTINGKMVSLTLKPTRDEFEGLIMDLVDRTIETVEEAIKKAQDKDETIVKDSIDSILLVGGSTYIPLVQRKLAEYFGREPSKEVNPDLAVALGAAVYSASAPPAAGVHRVRLARLPEVTAKTEIQVKGRTTPGSKIEIKGAAAAVTGEADGNGKFSLRVELKPDAINLVNVKATDPQGEVRSGGLKIRQDTNFTGKEERPKGSGQVGNLTPRALGVRVSGEDDRMGIVLPAQTKTPVEVVNRDFSMSSVRQTRPGLLPVDLYEGDIPYAPLNTHLGNLMIRCPPLPNGTPLEIKFRVTEDQLLYASVVIIPDPSLKAEATIKCESPDGARLHVLERTERVLNIYADKLRPEDKAKLQKHKQGLKDLCEQYKKNPEKDCYEKIKQIGGELRASLDSIESAH